MNHTSKHASNLSLPLQSLQGFETLRKLNKGQFDDWLRRDELKFPVRE